MRGRTNRSTVVWRAHLLVALFTTIAAARAVSAQTPSIGIIDFYGLRTLKPADLAGALRLQIGDTLGVSSDVLRMRLLSVPGVKDASVNPVCCEDGRLIVYVGVSEATSSSIEFAAAPNGSARLPADIMATGDDLNDALFEGVRRGHGEEDDSAGYSVFLYPRARAIQTKLIDYAMAHAEQVRDVLRNSRDVRHRALAAQMIAYTRDKPAVVQDLLRAVRDPNGDVRNNAIRALAIMAIYEQKHPDAGVHIPATPFIELLNSLDWTDRNKASLARAAISATRDPEMLRMLREQALDALVEMTRWHSFGHAAAAGVILGRIAGLPEDQIFPMLQKNREGVIAAAIHR